MGVGEPFGRFGGGRGRRSRRGDVRAAVLLLLGEEPRNGYQIIQELADRSGGAWRPSPGSIYPVLSQLEDEGLVEALTVDGARRFTLTAAGREALEQGRVGFGRPWDAVAAAVGEPRTEVMRAVRQVVAAARQVLEAGSEAQAGRVAEILKDARRRIYSVLAEEEPTT
jgi:DNA-binding PadR family transcriptional regulator